MKKYFGKYPFGRWLHSSGKHIGDGTPKTVAYSHYKTNEYETSTLSLFTRVRA
jgi:hypothetical protein